MRAGARELLWGLAGGAAVAALAFLVYSQLWGSLGVGLEPTGGGVYVAIVSAKFFDEVIVECPGGEVKLAGGGRVWSGVDVVRVDTSGLGNSTLSAVCTAPGVLKARARLQWAWWGAAASALAAAVFAAAALAVGGGLPRGRS